MNRLQIGNTDIYTAPLILGTNVMGWTINEKESHTLLDAFLDMGGNMIDTADLYAKWGEGNKGGESETAIGNWLKKTGKRHEVVIATKVGADMGNGNKGLSKQYIIYAVEQSLRRLQTHYIDLYQTHFDTGEVPVSETLEAYNTLIKQGKVRYIGASNISPQRLTESLRYSIENNLAAYQCLQPHYNLYHKQDYETHYQPLCLEHNLGVIPYFPLASGFLTGKYRTEADFAKSIRGSSMHKFCNHRGFRIIDALQSVAQSHQTVPAAVALHWLCRQPGIIAPIASATSVAQWKELWQSVSLSLTEEDLALLQAAAAD